MQALSSYGRKKRSWALRDQGDLPGGGMGWVFQQMHREMICLVELESAYVWLVGSGGRTRRKSFESVHIRGLKSQKWSDQKEKGKIGD